jgi:DNA-binding protein H-NS
MTEDQPKPRKGPAPGYKAPVKYRGPNGETWTGRGRLVKWIKDSGKDKEEFKI